ncbi:MAG: bifunctional methylenetetrahydrofolate dehydrogenase/methenyltetrahydrofolate cyclohydrolase FolD [Alphaproteobacteria bacterium]
MSEAAVIDGKAHALRLRARVAEDARDLLSAHGIQPGLAAVLVGDNPASQVYVRNKTKATLEAGLKSFEHRLPKESSQRELLDLVKRLNDDRAVNGILVQLPLPTQIDPQAVLDALDPMKDVDGFHVVNAGRLATGGAGMVPCTPLGCLMLIKDQVRELAGLRALVLGRSNIVGKPMAQLLLREHATVTVAHSRTRDLRDECRRADVLVAAIGRPEMVKGDWIKPGAIVIDVGINRIESGDGKTRLVGDVEYQAARRVARAITPVPGGVGPMTIACLLRNTVAAARRQHGLDA